ncbi:hypothetical protein RJT34_09943 [Clitoria ternatea]|uniref:Uncharacterized protein n=1 Tax=Clitoria ternatea TaxID=43366 RepID=A0AAN9K7H2_CLITE
MASIQKDVIDVIHMWLKFPGLHDFITVCSPWVMCAELDWSVKGVLLLERGASPSSLFPPLVTSFIRSLAAAFRSLREPRRRPPSPLADATGD